MTGIIMSVTTRSGADSRTIRSAAAPSVASVTSCPARSKIRRSKNRWSGSSSTTRILDTCHRAPLARLLIVLNSTRIVTSGRARRQTAIPGPAEGRGSPGPPANWVPGLADLPGVGAGQQGGQVTVALAGPGVGDLGGHQLVVGVPGDLAEHADRGVREVGIVQ